MVSIKLKTSHEPTPDLLSFDWSTPLEDWPDEDAVRLPEGRHRHVVRFVEHQGSYFALKELPGRLAEKEYHNLEFLAEADLPVVTLLGIVTGRVDKDGEPLDSVLLTRHLSYSLPYLHLFTQPGRARISDGIIDALAILLVRIHLHGFYWGDCSLGNALFRRDAGALMAYLVDTETSQVTDTISDGVRHLDLEIARDNIGGGLYELEVMGVLEPDIDPAEVADHLVERYESLWSELTHTEAIDSSELWQIQKRLENVNELGFDTVELEIVEETGERRVRFRPMVVEEGHHRRQLAKLTGISAQENQARRLLASMSGYGAWLAEAAGAEFPEAIVAYRWLTERYQPTLASIPSELRERLDDAEIYHQILDHLWYLSEDAGCDVGIELAVERYLNEILPATPDEKAVIET